MQSERLPVACEGLTDDGYMRLSASESGAACLALVLGVVTAGGGSRFQEHAALRSLRGVMRAVCDMARLAQRASMRATALQARQAFEWQTAQAALHDLRMHTWARPREAGGVCACCEHRGLWAGEVHGQSVWAHGARDEVGGGRPRRARGVRSRLVTAGALRWAAMQAAEGQAARVASVTQRLQVEVGRDEQRQAEAERELSVARAAVQRRDRVSGERPEAAETCVERRSCVLSAGVAQVEADGAARQVQAARDQLAWWRVHAKKIVGRARQRSAAAAETERSAKRLGQAGTRAAGGRGGS